MANKETLFINGIAASSGIVISKAYRLENVTLNVEKKKRLLTFI